MLLTLVVRRFYNESLTNGTVSAPNDRLVEICMTEVHPSFVGNNRLSLLSVFQQGVYRELLQDFQDYLFLRFKRPSLILIPHQEKGFFSCFPRKRDPLPAELFHHLLATISKSRLRFPVELDERKHSEECLRSGSPEEVGWWGWHTSDMGLVDYYHPLVLPLQGMNLAVLVFGKYRSPTKSGMLDLHKWIDQILAFTAAESDLSADRFQAEAYVLHELAAEIPLISPTEQRSVERYIKEAIGLTQVFLKSTFNVSALLRGDSLIDTLGLGQPNINIGEEQLWHTVAQALGRIIEKLGLTSAVVYAARHRDPTEMLLVAAFPDAIAVAPSFGFTSKAEFDRLQGESWVNIPSSGDFLDWVMPRQLFANERGILFGGEMIGGNLILIGFGQGERPLAPHGRVALYDAVTSRIFRFIDNAFFGIELDHLMAETGHLMGRAVGKVSLGAQVLDRMNRDYLQHAASADVSIYRKALWAIEDGRTNLELIRQNFYAFQTRRRNAEAKNHIVVDETAGDLEIFDVASVVANMRGYFDRAVAEAEKKSIKYIVANAAIRVRGDRNAFRLTLLNVFDNALKFSYANTYITIAVASQKSTCSIAFTNLGIGVARDEQAAVFQAFTKSRFKDIYRRIEGLGLGLSYCRWAIEEIFGGTIALASAEAKAPKYKFEGDNWLTTVTITLPLARQMSLQEVRQQ